MHDESISQAEIDALVRGLGGSARSVPAPQAASGGEDSAALLMDVLRLFVTHAGQALSDLVGTPCRAALSDVQNTSCQGAQSQMTGQVLIGKSALASGLPGHVYWVVPLPLALSMITQIYGGVAPSAMDDSALAALADGLAQMNQAGLVRIGEALGRPVFAGTVEVSTTGSLVDITGLAGTAHVTVAGVQLHVGEEQGSMLLVLPPTVTGPLAQAQRDKLARGAAAAPAPTAPPPQPALQAASVAHVAAALAAPAMPSPAYQPARFPDMNPRAGRDEIRNIDLLMDVALQVTVELGRTRKQIRDVLSLGPGSVVELDKLAGEQVDVLVNGKLIAKGEVVVIDENYGVRITDIVSPVDRVQTFR